MLPCLSNHGIHQCPADASAFLAGRDPEQTLLGHHLRDIPGVVVAVSPFQRAGGEVTLGEGPDRVAEEGLFLVQMEIHVC